ncbi:hypothetical protein [Embleya hyalina]|uniref:Uncharacterized protein n=1 Tax=Embleya hyalina TaxID=516124 RepID=A0A401Z410_9ACTN|nr:hypothetical protein [Embleya hyalina]GCE01565.1 hypothetical protein EHYA_09331 [Embleya hyalina]
MSVTVTGSDRVAALAPHVAAAVTATVGPLPHRTWLIVASPRELRAHHRSVVRVVCGGTAPQRRRIRLAFPGDQAALAMPGPDGDVVVLLRARTCARARPDDLVRLIGGALVYAAQFARPGVRDLVLAGIRHNHDTHEAEADAAEAALLAHVRTTTTTTTTTTTGEHL